jgi:hypothetical protein
MDKTKEEKIEKIENVTLSVTASCKFDLWFELLTNNVVEVYVCINFWITDNHCGNLNIRSK